MIHRGKATSEVLQHVVDSHNSDTISLFDLKSALHERGFGLLMAVCGLLLAFLPPGLNAIPCIPALIFAIQMIFGADSPWLPQWLGHKAIPRRALAALVEKTSPGLRCIERFLKPRLLFMSSRGGEKMIGLFSLGFVISVLIPLPFTNLVPSIGIILMSLGNLSRDGILVIVGMVVGSVGLVMTSAVILLGSKAVYKLIENIAAIV